MFLLSIVSIYYLKFHINKLGTLFNMIEIANTTCSTRVVTSMYLHPLCLNQQPPVGKALVKKVSLNQLVSLCLACLVKPNNLTNSIPPDIVPLLQELADVCTQPTGLPPARSIEHTIALVDTSSGLSLTYLALHQNAKAIAVELHGLGIRKRNVELVFSPNSIALPCIHLAILSIGEILTAANPFSIENKIKKQAQDSGSVITFAI